MTLEQRKATQFPFAPQAKANAVQFRGGPDGRLSFRGEQYGHAVWSNFPVSDVPRPGLRYGQLTVPQRTALMTLLRSLLSQRGFEKVLDIMGSDEALARTGTMQFGGHHLGLNVVIADGHGVLAPLHTGAMPATYAHVQEGRPVRALAAENDRAFLLLSTLRDVQRRNAAIDHDVSSLTFGPGLDGEAIPRVRLNGSDMSGLQRQLLFDLITEWAAVIADAYSAPRLAEIKRVSMTRRSPGADQQHTPRDAMAHPIFELSDRRSQSSSRRRRGAIQRNTSIQSIAI